MGDLIAEKQIDSRANSSSLVGWPWNGKSGAWSYPIILQGDKRKSY